MSASEFLQWVVQGDVQAVKQALNGNPSLASSVDESGVSAILKSVYHGHRPVTEALLASGIEPDIFEASATGLTERARALLRQNPDLLNAYSPDGFFPLGLAIFFRHSETFEALLEAGADVHQRALNPMKVTALHAAAASGQVEAVRQLLKRGADPDSRQQGGLTALHAAGHSGNLELAQLLLEYGADPDLQTDDGKTALALATEKNHREVAEFLQRKAGS